MIQEEHIYELITNSAKTQFDYTSFEKYFSVLGENLPSTSGNDIADKTLWLILMYLAGGEKPDIIALKIQNEIIFTGFFIEDISSLEKIIADNVDNWEKEIGVLKMATDMLNSNFASVDQVYDFVSNMLANQNS